MPCGRPPRLQSARSVWRQSFRGGACASPSALQSARSVWRQRKTQKSFALTRWVAICTERVEAKYRGQRKAARRTRCNLHGACGGKASRRRSDRGCYARCNLHGACGGKALYRSAVSSGENVAICTERVEAKVSLALSSAGVVVAICTERVEAKLWGRRSGCWIRLQSARSVWRQRARALPTTRTRTLQSARSVWRQSVACADVDAACRRCNLHGACGGKDRITHSTHSSFPLQSARGVWKTLHHPPEKNPRKFMQTYCIFIHLGV